MDNMDESLDKTTQGTIALLEARLLRIEHILYGPSRPVPKPPTESVITTLTELERRFALLVQHPRFRVYADILKIYKAHPSLFAESAAPSPHDVPTDLPEEALLATVLSYAPSFSSISSSLTAITADNSPIPDPSLSVELAALAPRIKGVELMQMAQEAEIAELRRRSEAVMRQWVEGSVLRYSQAVADAEGRVEKVERVVRGMEKSRELESSAI